MSFLQRSLVVVIAALGLGALGSKVQATKWGSIKDTYPPGNCAAGPAHALWLDGAPAGWVRSVEGGEATSDIIEDIGPTGLRKRPSPVKFQNITFRVGSDADPKLKDWIQDFLSGGNQRKPGYVITYNIHREATERRTFTDALISEVKIPALDATVADEPFLMTVTISPARTVLEVAPTATPAPNWQGEQGRYKDVFRIECFGDPGTSARISKIDSFTIKQRVIAGLVVLDISETRVFPETNNLGSGPSVEALNAWAEDFLVAGNNTPDREWSGLIEFIGGDPDRPMAIALDGLGIYEWGRPVLAGDHDSMEQTLTLREKCAEIPLSAGIVVNGIHLIF